MKISVFGETNLRHFKLVTCLIAVMASGTIESVADIQRRYCEWSDSNITYRARLPTTSSRSPSFLSLCAKCCHHYSRTGYSPHWLFRVGSYSFHQFKQILIQDGSFCREGFVEEILSRSFQNHQSAAVELQVTMDLLADQPCSISLTPDTASERDYLPPDPQALSGRLLLVDRGYFDLAWFQRLQDVGGFISYGQKQHQSTVVSAHREDGKMLKHVGEKRSKRCKASCSKRQRTELIVCLEKGETTITARLVAFWIRRERNFSWLIAIPQTQFRWKCTLEGLPTTLANRIAVQRVEIPMRICGVLIPGKSLWQLD